jgi:hypothetical protein
MDRQEQDPEVVQERLEILWHKLEGEGMYVGANTVAMAQALIEQLTGVKPHQLKKTS